MKNALKSAVLAVTMVLGLACGGSSVAFGCDLGTGAARVCTEFGGSALSTAAAVDVLKAQCTSQSGTVGSGCSRSGAVGGCELTVTVLTVSSVNTVWYYTGDAATLKTSCEAQTTGLTTARWVTP